MSGSQLQRVLRGATEGPDYRPTAEDFAHSRLGSYIRYHWPGFQVSAHHKLILKTLERVERGEIKRLLITMPPRHGKSLIASENFPGWYLGRNSEHSIIHACHTQDLADDFGRKIRNQLNSPDFSAVFPEVSLSPNSNSARRFNVSSRGSYFAVGIGGPVTGRGANLLIIDDPIKTMEQAESDTQRKKMVQWFNAVAYTRLAPEAAIVVIQTRWHEGDLAGHILANSPEEWTVLSLPAIAEASDVLGRGPGDALWPEAFPATRLEVIKQTVGSRVWTSLYQQRPTAEAGGIIKLDWFKRFSTPPANPIRIVQSWDTAKKPKEINDPSVCSTWFETETGMYLIDVIRHRWEFPDLVRMAKSKAAQYNPHALLIEDAASGTSLIQTLQTGTMLPVIGITPHEAKEIRAQACAPVIEAGRVFLPEEASWLADYEVELLQFPNGNHDDQVDSTTQYLNWAREPADIFVG
jgi:predicted phage terminase large subunit-like protein